MKYKTMLPAAMLALLFPLYGEAHDISTISIWRNGTFEDLPVPPPPEDPETVIPKKIKRHTSEPLEDPRLREALLSYFDGADLDHDTISYAWNEADLDGGKKEALVLVTGDEIDKTGKPLLLIFTRNQGRWVEGQALTSMEYPLLIPKRNKKMKEGSLAPFYFLSVDDEGKGRLRRLTAEDNIYPPAANGEEMEPKEIKKLKGDAFFCATDQKKTEITWFSLARRGEAERGSPPEQETP